MTIQQNDYLTKWLFDKMTIWQNDYMTKWLFDNDKLINVLVHFLYFVNKKLQKNFLWILATCMNNEWAVDKFLSLNK